jgi:hypothetical protein
MAVKLLMTWDILPGREQEYFEFVVRELIPGMQHLGLEPSDAWFTMYGDQPQILAIVQSASMAKLEEVLASSEWDNITNQLMDYVEDLNYKVVPARTGFQL